MLTPKECEEEAKKLKEWINNNKGAPGVSPGAIEAARTLIKRFKEAAKMLKNPRRGPSKEEEGFGVFD